MTAILLDMTELVRIRNKKLNGPVSGNTCPLATIFMFLISNFI